MLHILISTKNSSIFGYFITNKKSKLMTESHHLRSWLLNFCFRTAYIGINFGVMWFGTTPSNKSCIMSCGNPLVTENSGTSSIIESLFIPYDVEKWSDSGPASKAHCSKWVSALLNTLCFGKTLLWQVTSNHAPTTNSKCKIHTLFKFSHQLDELLDYLLRKQGVLHKTPFFGQLLKWLVHHSIMFWDLQQKVT